MFKEVIRNQTALLYSLRDNAAYGQGHDAMNPLIPAAVAAPVYTERALGGSRVWATVGEVNQHGVQNLDSLEIFGPEGADDAYLFSLKDDAFGCAVWDSASKTCRFTQAFIGGLVNGLLKTDIALEKFDVDGMMVNGDDIMFSLWPILGTAIQGDGVYVFSGGNFNNLNHGGQWWKEGWLGVNVDALEAAVPEPASLALLGMGPRRPRDPPAQEGLKRLFAEALRAAPAARSCPSSGRSSTSLNRQSRTALPGSCRSGTESPTEDTEKRSPTIAARVIGVTPTFPIGLYRETGSPVGPVREHECRTWLKENARDATLWLTLDDQRELFSESAPVVWCDPQTGLTDESIQAIRKWVRDVRIKYSKLIQSSVASGGGAT